jgi:hypothetical protein
MYKALDAATDDKGAALTELLREDPVTGGLSLSQQLAKRKAVKPAILAPPNPLLRLPPRSSASLHSATAPPPPPPHSVAPSSLPGGPFGLREGDVARGLRGEGGGAGSLHDGQAMRGKDGGKESSKCSGKGSGKAATGQRSGLKRGFLGAGGGGGGAKGAVAASGDDEVCVCVCVCIYMYVCT